MNAFSKRVVWVVMSLLLMCAVPITTYATEDDPKTEQTTDETVDKASFITDPLEDAKDYKDTVWSVTKERSDYTKDGKFKVWTIEYVTKEYGYQVPDGQVAITNLCALLGAKAPKAIEEFNGDSHAKVMAIVMDQNQYVADKFPNRAKAAREADEAFAYIDGKGMSAFAASYLADQTLNELQKELASPAFSLKFYSNEEGRTGKHQTTAGATAIRDALAEGNLVLIGLKDHETYGTTIVVLTGYKVLTAGEETLTYFEVADGFDEEAPHYVRANSFKNSVVYGWSSVSIDPAQATN